MLDSSLYYVCYREDIVLEANKTISDLPKQSGGFSTICEDTVDTGYFIFEEGVYFLYLLLVFLKVDIN